MTSDRATALARQLVARAEVLLRETVELDEGVRPRGRLVGGLGPRGWLAHPAVAVFLNVIVVSSVTEAVFAAVSDRFPAPRGFGVVLLRIVVAWVLAFAPGLIFIRYLSERIPLMWDGFVLALYRIGLDSPENLPRPPLSSPFYESWQAAGGEGRLQHRNFYRQKFDALYGASVSSTGLDRLHRARVEAVLPVFPLTTLLSVGWTALLWDLHNLDLGSGAAKVWTSPAFGFLGAYIFAVNKLARRYLENDLRGSAYVVLARRIVIVFIVAVAAHPLLDKLDANAATQAVVMFVVGIFPSGLLRAVQRLMAKSLQTAVPSLRPEQPLGDLDGMSIWYESKLLDLGLGDMQQLVTANIVDLLAQNQIPATLLIDWIDQSLLLLHLPGRDQGVHGRPRQGLASKLRRLGIRTATDLLAVFPAEEMEPRSEQTGWTEAASEAVSNLGVDAMTVRTLVRVVSSEPALRLVRNWESGGRASTASASAEPRDR